MTQHHSISYVTSKIHHMQRFGIPARLSPNGAAISDDLLSQAKERAEAILRRANRTQTTINAFTFKSIAPYLRREGF